MRKIALLCLLFALWMQNSFATPRDEPLWVQGQKMAFTHVSEKIFVSQNCVSQETTCQAIGSAKKAKLPPKALRGTPNPGTVICAQLGGMPIVAKDIKQNQISFCRFADGSMISSGSIVNMAVSNR